MYIYLYIYLSSDLSFLCMYVFFFISYLLFLFFLFFLFFLSFYLSLSIYPSIHLCVITVSTLEIPCFHDKISLCRPGLVPCHLQEVFVHGGQQHAPQQGTGSPRAQRLGMVTMVPLQKWWCQWPCNRNRLSGGTYHKAYVTYVREYPHKMVQYLHFRILEFPLMMAGIVDGIGFTIWLVVYLPLWKIWVRQLGWWNYQYMDK